eukprot:TRINITY_DN2791_c0_g1_i1.p2 TRINITY_DN2791_c0_g1~~TRINITY_DN2791_c0_g1_i1.p2  ORF type:complete len:140 (+),score=38.39 TRINITY_DN2791_c0_g1_i1:46-465(+)
MADHKNKAHNKQAAALAKLAARRPACFGLPTTSQSQQRCFEPFTFCVLGDPQVGFGADGVEEDGARLAAAVRRARELVGATGALLVAGDLTDAWLPAEVRCPRLTPTLRRHVHGHGHGHAQNGNTKYVGRPWRMWTADA